jgi:lipopolysaccharide/colanic/teichoic acid biosynthesis glycosyltransferase
MGAQRVPPSSEIESKSVVISATRSANGGPGTYRLAKGLLLQRAAKRAFDIVFATIGLILFSPLLMLTSLAVLLDSRWPIVSGQVRYDYGRQPLRILRFRCTATENSDEAVYAGNVCVSRVGRILRSSGIDELPQLIDVLRGEMSIVGPRPYMVPPGLPFNDLILRISQQHKMKPGLIGWAQVNGCGDVRNSLRVIRRRIEYDLYYVENWSFRLDMKIILLTLCSMKAYVLSE